MDKKIIVYLSSKEAKTDERTSRLVIESFLENIKKELAAGGSVFIRGFGTFSPRQRADKTGRNITKGVSVFIPAHKIPHFKPAPPFKKMLKNKL